jgi:hypothetical protein
MLKGANADAYFPREIIEISKHSGAIWILQVCFGVVNLLINKDIFQSCYTGLHPLSPKHAVKPKG